MLLSRAHSAMDKIINTLPSFLMSKRKPENCRLVVTMTTPVRTSRVARYPLALNFSLKKSSANRTVKMVSEFDNMAVSDAVVFSSPVKKRLGARIEPETVIASTSGQSLRLTWRPRTLYESGTDDRAGGLAASTGNHGFRFDSCT